MCWRPQPCVKAQPCVLEAAWYVQGACMVHVQVLATRARHAFAATAINQHWRTPYVHVPMCGGNKGACGAAVARGHGGAAALPLSPYYP